MESGRLGKEVRPIRQRPYEPGVAGMEDSKTKSAGGSGRPQRYIEADEPLATCERCPTYVSWPVPIDRRLDELLDLAWRAGHDLNRHDLLAALVLAAPLDGKKIGALVIQSRRSKAGDAVSTKGPIPILPRKPGRRPKRAKALP
jgi:hypothetical protein